MSRRCTCSRLLAALHADPRLRTLPLAARALWLLLAEAMAQSETPGLLPFGSLSRVSLLVSAPETEVETHLETLIGEGLLARTPEGGLACPLLLQAASRASAARANGAAGGRPRRGETPEQARIRRAQGALLLPVPGALLLPVPGAAAAETQETKPGNLPTTSSSLSSQTQEGSSSPPARHAPAWVLLGSRIASIASLDPVRQRFDYSPVRAWQEEGLPESLILEAVDSVVAKPSYRPEKVSTLRYFEPAIRRLQETVPAPAVAEEADRPLSAQAQAIEAWIARGMQGPKPALTAA